MSIPFVVRYKVKHHNGPVQSGTFVIWARKAAEARLLGRERVRMCCGEDAAWLTAEPQEEGAHA